MHWLTLAVCLSVGAVVLCADPTNYEYYTQGGIHSGLKAEGNDFTLNGKVIRLFSGSLHYFRLPQQYWRDRLRKMKAGGLNTVQTYVAWNLHEEKEGHFDFETGYLNLADFLKAAKEEDLFVYLRPGPYICAEWEAGGYPAWMLKNRNLRYRSSQKDHLAAVEKYFNKVLSIANEYTFTKGGPIIALQYENEYGGIHNKNDQDYFDFLKNLVDKSGFKELLSNCDNGPAPYASQHTQNGVLETLNGNSNMYNQLMNLKKAQPHKPLHVTEFWPGWFDFWGDRFHHGMGLDNFVNEVKAIMFQANSSINHYMYFGGTNFGFTNGGDGNHGVTTSYDYNAPLSESGNYTDKYHKNRDLIIQLTRERNLPKINIPEPPAVAPAVAYGDIKVKDYLSWEDVLALVSPKSGGAKPMEDYDQQFGYIVYRSAHPKFNHATLNAGMNDQGFVIVDGKEKQAMPDSKKLDINFNTQDFDAKLNEHNLDLFVENRGRANGGDLNNQRKGLNGDVYVDNKKVDMFKVYSLDFKEDFAAKAKAAKGSPYQSGHRQTAPTLYRAELEVNGQPKDTFVRFDHWTKGIILVNGFNIGRYNSAGPQRALYLPAPLLKTGANDILIFELSSSADKLQSVAQPALG